MTVSIYGALRTDSTLSLDAVRFGGVGQSFQISDYSKITISDGADPTIISGDSTLNEFPNDPTQTLNGNPIFWDFTVQISDGTNTYEIGIMDYDQNDDGIIDGFGTEPGYFIAFLDGNIPPLNTTLTIQAITDNGASIPVSSVVPCFVSGSLIDTPDGPRKIETLGVGDAVLTLDNGPQTIRWIGRQELCLRELSKKPKLAPIRITAGALGANLPLRDLCVSPQHRVLVRSPIAKRMFGAEEALIPARKLIDIPGIFVDTVKAPVTYLHMLFDSHEIVLSEGAPTESLFTGKEALKAVGDAAYDEIMALFPELSAADYLPRMARFCPPKGKHMKTLVRRHVSNRKPLLAMQ
ncbi:hypothetical protein GCM10016455_11220 [Aliiroseovarius zhejiangensis]|uniref:Hedgehog/Intein (Hint) domain-containing protein n=1 Tax=Aliiroseovarius zhejiangensis TaxID=1632025 RepID=A0ABQ3ISZ3_9RHOB|nr:Hint domain-containing protein [Aliiroseovarius zhejiangensis]GHE92872.1 hypothetical protein GCM10016455_11220 [Aliiroseovarius zhejiangensis]